MTLAECRTLKRGDEVTAALGNGWYQTMTFVGLTQITSWGRFDSIEQFLNEFGKRKGRTEWFAECVWEEDGKRKTDYYRPRKLTAVTKR